MDLQSQVWVYSDELGVKKAKGKLLQIHPEGYYEVALDVSGRQHRALLPINGTVLLATEPMAETESIAVERY
jgi:hypothetical protein